MINIIVWTIMGILWLISIYIIFNLNKKIKRFETYFESIDKKIHKILIDLRRLDKKEMFERDDEVGVLWERIKEIIDSLREFVIVTEKEETE